jgi:lipopolysaccharide heptosyltransferase I
MEDVFLKPPPLCDRQFERILLIKPSALGDVIHALPILVKLRARYPSAQIDWLLTPDNAELIRHHPALSNVVYFDRRLHAQFGRSWPATTGLVRSILDLWKRRYDLVIDLHGQFRSAFLTLATAAKVRIGFDRPLPRVERVRVQQEVAGRLHGWAGAREGAWIAYSHRIPIRTLEIHAVDRYLWLAPLLGFDNRPPDFRIYLPAEVEKKIDRLMAHRGSTGRRLGLLAPGTTWETKHWRRDGFVDLARDFLRQGFDVVLAGAPRDRLRCQMIKEACPHAIDLSGETNPAELAALIRRASICVTNDSGAMHLAVAMNRPVVAVFGPTSPLLIGPYGRPSAVVRVPLACSPCHLRKLRDCPHRHACMKEVTSQMVLERVDEFLSSETSSRIAS